MSSNTKAAFPVISLFAAGVLIAIASVKKLPALGYGVFIGWWIAFGIWYKFHKYD